MPQDASEDIFEYSVRTLIEIKHSELNKELKKELREWVLKNAFLKELKTLEIIKNKEVDTKYLIRLWKTCEKSDKDILWKFNWYIRLEENKLTQKEFNLLKEMLYVQEEKNRP